MLLPHNKFILLKKTTKIFGAVELPSSKSISNRVLILNALSGFTAAVHNLSGARDTVILQKALQNPNWEIDIRDAGTCMRFLTAYFAVKNKDKVLLGTNKMHLRPVGPLVEALNAIGFDIHYLEKAGFPPLRIHSITDFEQKERKITVSANVSSQFISALLMIAPLLPEGLRLKLEGKVTSESYIQMTLSLMKEFGAKIKQNGSTITISEGKYQSAEIIVEPDWSSASYWYALVALADEAEIMLKGLLPPEKSLQGDSVMVKIGKLIGVTTTFSENNAVLTKSAPSKIIDFDFTDCPDLAPTVAVVCAAKGIDLTMKGIGNLRIKESDRIEALKTELPKIGAELIEISDHIAQVIPSSIAPSPIPSINTYNDHRIAMTFAALATQRDISVENPTVVEKSYPGFWEDLQAVGMVF